MKIICLLQKYFWTGQAGIDFPVLASVPQTSFNCNTQKFPGIYTDVDADCQVGLGWAC